MRAAPLAIRNPKSVYSAPDDPDIVGLEDRLVQSLAESSEGTVVPVSLRGSVLSASCFARLLGNALRGVSLGLYSGRYVVVQDSDGDNDWDADAALRKVSAEGPAKLVCVWKSGDGRPQLIGDVDRVVQETYDFIWDREREGAPATTREMAEAYKMRIQAASNRVSKAAALGVVRAVEEQPAEGGGVQRLLVAVQ